LTDFLIREADDCKLCIQEDCSHFDQNSDLRAADFGILKYQEVCGKSARGRKMAEESNGNNLCESSDSIMTILDQMADSVQLDYTDQFSKDVEPTSSGLLELEQSKVCFHNGAKIILKLY